jgi:hypothetical protein
MPSAGSGTFWPGPYGVISHEAPAPREKTSTRRSFCESST